MVLVIFSCNRQTTDVARGRNAEAPECIEKLSRVCTNDGPDRLSVDDTTVVVCHIPQNPNVSLHNWQCKDAICCCKMSASHRKLRRLPLEVFDDLLVTMQGQETMTPQDLRSAIVEKLQRFRVRSRQYGGTTTITMSLKTVGDLLRTPPFILLQALDPLLTFGEINLLLKRICHQCSTRPVTCATLLARTCANLEKDLILSRHCYQPILTQSQEESPINVFNSSIGDRMRFLPTGLLSLDRRKNDSDGGIRLGNITEVVGRAGAGKTQFALQLVLMAAKYNQGAMYIDTEKKLILERLREMAAQRWSQRNNVVVRGAHQQGQEYLSHGPFHDTSGLETSRSSPSGLSFGFKHPDDVLRNMTVRQPNSTEELLNVLELAEEEILHRNQDSNFPVRLLIVDSIAAPLKRDFGANSVPQRAATAFSIAQILKRYAEQLHLAVIVVNQVGLEGSSASSFGKDGERRHDQVAVRAALGTSWHHCVSTRLLVDHEVDPHRDGGRDNSSHKSQRRSLNVVKSNWMPPTTVHFEITPIGIVEAERAEDDDLGVKMKSLQTLR